MKLTNAQILEIDDALKVIEEDATEAKDPWFAYGVSQIRMAFEPAVKACAAADAPLPRVIELQNRSNELLEKHAKKRSNGRPKYTSVQLPGGGERRNYEIEDPEALDKAQIELLEEYSGLDDEVIKHKERYQEVLQEEVELDIPQLKMSEAPANITKGPLMRVLLQNEILIWDLKK